jgi:two-component system, cell cycle sensor histidine kinase and response regulator CckA
MHRNHSATILVVEDDAAVRRFVITLLKRFGYRIIEADSGFLGLEYFVQYRDGVDLILTDVLMPRMLGTEMVKEIRKIDSSVRVMFMTGNADGAISPGSGSQMETPVLSKPFTPQTLLRTVEECLAA